MHLIFNNFHLDRLIRLVTQHMYITIIPSYLCGSKLSFCNIDDNVLVIASELLPYFMVVIVDNSIVSS